MFKKIYRKIDALKDYVIHKFDKNFNELYGINKNIKHESANIQSKFNNTSKIIESQQRTIEQLTNALKDKYEHGIFIFSEDCKIPMVIRNGKELTNDLTTCFSIEWNRGETPLINIEQAAGTIADLER
jgi:hypothetical protein